MIRLVQIGKVSAASCCAGEEPHLRCLAGVESVYELASACLREGASLSQRAQALATGESLLYDDVYSGQSEWRLLSPIDVARRAGARSRLRNRTDPPRQRQRQAGHACTGRQPATNPSQTACACFSWALPVGVQKQARSVQHPNGSTKGTGKSCSLLSEPLTVPAHAEDGGEEAEIAGIYVIANDGTPYRIGMCAGNEFSDHRFERRNYLNLAGSKLRQCSIGPELVVGADFRSVAGEVSIERAGMTTLEEAD